MYFPDTESLARFGETGPQPQFLLDSQRLKMPVAGRGVMTVDGEPLPVGPGSTVIALEGATRGLVAETPLVFLAAKAA